MALTKDLTFQFLGKDGLSSVLGKISGSASSATEGMGKGFQKLGGLIGGEFGNVLTEAGDGIEHLSGHMKDIGAATSIAGGVMAGAGAALQNFASDGEAATNQLKAAIDNAGGSYEESEGKIEKAVAAGAKYGQNAVDTKNALQGLIQANGSVSQSLSILSVAQNLAAAKHEALGSAVTQLNAVMAGKGTRTLQQFGIEALKTGTATQKGTQYLSELSQKLSGQAAAAADTFKGKVTALKTEISNWAEEMAGHLGPILQYTGIGFTVLGLVIEKWGTITKIGTAIQAAFNSVMDANPIALIILGIVALIAVIVLLITHWKQVTSFLTSAWGTAVKFVQSGLTTLGAFWTSMWNVIKVTFNTVWSWVKNAFLQFTPWGWMIQGVTALVSNWSSIWANIKQVVANVSGNIKGIVSDMWNGVSAIFRGGVDIAIIDPLNGLISALNGAVSLIDKIPGVSIGHIPTIPRLAAGGIVNRPTTLLAGESGPEAIVPLNAGKLGIGGGSTVIHVNVTPGSSVSAAREFAQEISSVLINGIRNGHVNATTLARALGSPALGHA